VCWTRDGFLVVVEHNLILNFPATEFFHEGPDLAEIEVGHDFNPKDGTLWFTHNQTDGMGDDIPSGEINRITKAGQFFGYPRRQGRTRISEQGLRQGPAAGQHHRPAGVHDRACSRSGHGLLHRQDVPGEVPARFLLGATWVVESHQGWSARRSCSRP
jgi:hypothetical protein